MKDLILKSVELTPKEKEQFDELFTSSAVSMKNGQEIVFLYSRAAPEKDFSVFCYNKEGALVPLKNLKEIKQSLQNLSLADYKNAMDIIGLNPKLFKALNNLLGDHVKFMQAHELLTDKMNNIGQQIVVTGDISEEQKNYIKVLLTAKCFSNEEVLAFASTPKNYSSLYMRSDFPTSEDVDRQNLRYNHIQGLADGQDSTIQRAVVSVFLKDKQKGFFNKFISRSKKSFITQINIPSNELFTEELNHFIRYRGHSKTAQEVADAVWMEMTATVNPLDYTQKNEFMPMVDAHKIPQLLQLVSQVDGEMAKTIVPHKVWFEAQSDKAKLEQKIATTKQSAVQIVGSENQSPSGNHHKI